MRRRPATGRRKRIAVFVPSTTAALHFLRPRFYAELAEHYELFLVCYAGVHVDGIDVRDFAEVRTLAPEQGDHGARRVWLMYFSMWSERRITRGISNSFERLFVMNLAYASRWRLWAAFYLPGLVRPVARLITRVMEWYVGGNAEIAATIRDLDPDLVIGHGRGYDARDIDLIKCARRLGVPLLSLQINWDVWSHRGVLPVVPDYVGVWGGQCAQWIEYIHRVPRERIFLMGSPFSDILRAPLAQSREATLEALGLPLNKTVIVVAGAGRGVNETAVLIMLERAIEAGALKDCCVLYRPHPLRHRPRYEPNYFEQGFKHVVLDPVLAGRYREAVTAGMPMSKHGEIPLDHEHARRLFSIASVLVAPISTFMLEGACAGVPGVEIAFVDRANEAQALRYDLASTAYFQSLPGVFVCARPATLIDKVRQALDFGADAENVAVMRAHVDAAIYQDERPVSRRIAEAVETIMGDADMPYHFLHGEGGRSR